MKSLSRLILLLSFIISGNVFSQAQWRLGAGLSPYRFKMQQRGDAGDSSYASTVLNSYRLQLQKQNRGWIWNNELNLSFLNFTNGQKESISLYDVHSGFQWRGWLGGIESSKNLFLDKKEALTQARNLRSHWLALGYRFTPKNQNWRIYSKLSLPLLSSLEGETIESQAGYRFILGYEHLGVFPGRLLKSYSWSILPYLDYKKWDLNLKSSGNQDVQFTEFGLALGINRLW